MATTTRLGRYLRRNHESARAFAKRSGVHYSRICRYLSGESTPGRASALAIEVATGGEVSAESWDAPRSSPAPRRSAARAVASR